MPSTLSTAWLVTLAAILAGAFVWTAGRDSRAVAVMPVRTRADRGVALALLGLWLVPSGVLAGAGLLSSFDRLPPPLMQVVAATTVATSIVACSGFGWRFAGRAGLAGLVGFQVFRVPLELLLHRLYGEGVLPVQMTYEGATALDGDLPVNMSGGVLSSNPIGASGLIRFAEAAMQVRGQAGEHQVDGVHKALGHAYGGGSQYFSTYIVADHKP